MSRVRAESRHRRRAAAMAALLAVALAVAMPSGGRNALAADPPGPPGPPDAAATGSAVPDPDGLRPPGVPASAAPSPPPQPANGVPRAPAPVGAPGERLVTGRTLFGQSCASCHGQQGMGSDRGPSLVGVGAAASDFWLTTGRMPLAHPDDEVRRRPPVFDRDQIDALNTYIDSLGGGPAVPVVGPGDLREGQRLYATNCASCHSASGAGAVLPEGRRVPAVRSTDPVQIAEAIRLGPGAMPPFPAETFSDADVDAIVAYVRALHRSNAEGGAPIGTIGPVTEGVVGWLAAGALMVLVAAVLGSRAARRSR